LLVIARIAASKVLLLTASISTEGSDTLLI